MLDLQKKNTVAVSGKAGPQAPVEPVNHTVGLL